MTGIRRFAVNVVAASPYPQWYTDANLGTAAAGSVANITGASAALKVADLGSGIRTWIAPGPGAYGSLDWCSNLPYCSATKRIMAAGGRPGNSTPYRDSSTKLMYFNVFGGLTGGNQTEGVWDSIVRPFADSGTGGGHLYQSQCAATSIRRFFYYSDIPPGTDTTRRILSWNTETWQYDQMLTKTGHPSAVRDAACLMWMPNLGAQGSIVVAGSYGGNLYAYQFDWATKAWNPNVLCTTPYPDDASTPGHFAGIYVPQADACIFGKYSVGKSWSFRALRQNGSGLEVISVPAHPDPAWTLSTYNGTGIFTPDPYRAAAIHFSRTTGKIWTYEFSSNSWVERALLPNELNASYLAGATIPELGIVAAVSGGNSFAVANEMYAYKVPVWE